MRTLHLLALLLALPFTAMADEGHHHPDDAAETAAPVAPAPSIAARVTFEGPLEVNKPTVLHFHVSDAHGKPLGPNALETVHTRKFHLLVIDPSLMDYHHLHPEAEATPGDYRVTFTPGKAGGYRAWADLTPHQGAHAYVPVDLGSFAPAKIEKGRMTTATVAGYRFTLTFDTPLQVGAETMATLHVEEKGQPLTTLEPVMGAFAHLVGFSEDYHSILHTHPMGEEPTRMDARGGPDLMFHIEPAVPGFVKLFAQLRIAGRDFYVPFSVEVAPAKQP